MHCYMPHVLAHSAIPISIISVSAARLVFASSSGQQPTTDGQEGVTVQYHGQHVSKSRTWIAATTSRAAGPMPLVVVAAWRVRNQVDKENGKGQTSSKDRQMQSPTFFPSPPPCPPTGLRASHHPGPAYTLESHPCFHG